MRRPVWIHKHSWLIVPLIATGFLFGVNRVRMAQIEFVSAQVLEPVAIDPGSATGYAGGIRRLMVPGQNHDSYHWIAQTQQMLAQKEWRVRFVGYDNAPFGREVHTASAYRWWLGLGAWVDQFISGRPPGLAVESAALLADPVFHAVLLIATTVLIALQFGPFPAALVAVALAVMFPWASGLLAGAPDDHALGYACSLWSLLLIIIGFRAYYGGSRGKTADASHACARAARRWFAGSGIFSGVGLWINLPGQVVTLTGIVLGGAIAMILLRRSSGETTVSVASIPWRIWAGSGALTSVVVFLAEYAPDHIDLRQLGTFHPVPAILWLGAGEILVQLSRWSEGGALFSTWRERAGMLFGAGAVVTLLIAILAGAGKGWLTQDPFASQLTSISGTIVARNLVDWLRRDGVTPAAWATFLPLLLLLPGIWRLALSRVDARLRASTALVLGPLMLTIGLACFQLRWWSMVDVLLLPLLVVSVAPAAQGWETNRRRACWCLGLAFALAPGTILLWQSTVMEGPRSRAAFERDALAERDLAHWLNRRQRPERDVIALAAPDLTNTLWFHGGIRGLGTLSWENHDGIAAAIRIASATSPDEALELVQRRKVTHIIMPTWDMALDNLARVGSSSPGGTFVDALRQWAPPSWIRAVPYPIATTPQGDHRAMLVFEIVEEQDPATAAGRLVEYFLEMEMFSQAADFRPRLLEHPGDAGALAALAQIDAARGDRAGFQVTVDSLLSVLPPDGQLYLPWDRQVSIATVLAQAQRFDLARQLVKECLAVADEHLLRTLTSRSLFRLLVLSKGFALSFSDQRMHDLALDLLPGTYKRELQ